MGKLRIRGHAQKEYRYDQMEITIEFCAHAKNAASAIEQVLKQCEDFLAIMKENGFNIKNARLGDEDVNQDLKDLSVCATREIIVRMPLQVDCINTIMMVIAENRYDVQVETSYQLSKLTEIHEELIKMAIEDSKRKASFIAKTMNQKIVGIRSIESSSYEGTMDWMEDCQERACFRKLASLPHSNMLSEEITTESESVSVVWLIE